MRHRKLSPTNHFFTPPALAGAPDSQLICVPTQIRLPRTAYTAGHLASDLLAAFLPEPPARSRLKDVASGWEIDRLPSAPILQVRQQAADWFKFFSRFSRSGLRKTFLEYAAGNPIRAAQSFLDWLAVEAQASGSGHSPSVDGAGIGKLLAKHADGLNIPFAPPAPGPSHGSGTSALLTKALRVADLLPHVRRKYEFASRRKARRILSQIPADDLDIRPLRTWGELPRLVASEWIREDEDFVVRLAMRQLRIVEHYELEATPAQFVLLLDVSGSMANNRAAIEKGSRKTYTAEEWATACGIALCEQAQRGTNTVTLIPFDGAAHAAHTGTPAQIAAKLWECKFSGAGTNFDAAFTSADEHGESDAVVMITDGECPHRNVTVAPLHVLQVCGKDNTKLRADAAQYEIIV